MGNDTAWVTLAFDIRALGPQARRPSSIAAVVGRLRTMTDLQSIRQRSLEVVKKIFYFALNQQFDAFWRLLFQPLHMASPLDGLLFQVTVHAGFRALNCREANQRVGYPRASYHTCWPALKM